MDVTIPEIPSTYDKYRAGLRAFIAANAPKLDWKPRSGMRVPDSAEDVLALRKFVSALHDAGYRNARFSTDECDECEQRILLQELADAPPSVLGNPLVAGALKLFGTPEQKQRYLPPMSRGDHIWSQLFSEPRCWQRPCEPENSRGSRR